MSRPVISVNRLSKRYSLGQVHGDLLSERLSSNLRGLFGIFRGGKDHSLFPFHRSPKEEFWALKDVSCEIKRGEVVGIIGKNGAGKSTLLKILSRITEPTEGYAEIYGRVGSLLEVGTGFHPELTGRENIFLNGMILGMKKAEIRNKFDEIVAFAEVEKFIDTPVKRYSSGMYVRLAFAVAAHLEPEILLVDEVLAVGDAQFQKKCLGKMGEVAKEGRTVLFVSHNMGAISRLCTRCILLEQGRLKLYANPQEVVNAYIQGDTSKDAQRVWLNNDCGKDILLKAVRICQPIDKPASSIDITKPFAIIVEVDILREMEELTIACQILTLDGQVVLHTAALGGTDNREFSNKGRHIYRCLLPAYLLNVGRYTLNVGADIPYKEILFMEENAVMWNVESTSEIMGRYHASAWPGIIGPGIAKWTCDQISQGERQ